MRVEEKLTTMESILFVMVISVNSSFFRTEQKKRHEMNYSQPFRLSAIHRCFGDNKSKRENSIQPPRQNVKLAKSH